MPYVFRIHEQHGKAPNPSTFTSGWGSTTILSGPILDEIVTGSAVHRMGTSIPSIFARPILFQTAFDTLDPLHYADNGVSQKLVSEVLDMLEFLYQNAGNPALSTDEWVATTQLAALKANPDPKLHRFADALTAHLPKIGNPAKITLFFWTAPNAQGEEKRVLIGGTAPATLVFTSPNWIRKCRENGWIFNRLDGSVMFGSDIRPLSARNHEFRDMLINLRLTYNTELQTACGGNIGLCKYIFETKSLLGLNTTPLLKADFLAKYPPVKGVYAGDVPIPCQKVTPTGSGYMIRPTSNRYTTALTAAGAAVNVNVPLALNDEGLPGVAYMGGAAWKPSYKINEAKARVTPVYNRDLPGNMGISYPWIGAFDLLEDKIIKVRGKIDQKNFITLFDGESTFLIPLRRAFFDYFNVEDLEEVNPHTGKRLVEITASDTGVTVTVNMPISDPSYPSIPLSRTYSPADIVRTDRAIELGFFPFYTVEEHPELDTYSVMLSSGEGCSLKFIQLSPGSSVDLGSAGHVRSTQQIATDVTTYYDVNGPISYVEVSTPGGERGLVIPRMRRITPGTSQFQFAVDFGTSNTFVAYRSPAQTSPESLAFGNDTSQKLDDPQVVFLYDPVTLPQMIDTYQREFMIPSVGAAGSIASFPIKTTVSEVSLFGNQTAWNLFGNINVGFKFKNEITTGNALNTVYFTNLKWALEEDPGNKLANWRALAFCKQLLWILKNKALLNGGSPSFKVMLMFPESMIDRTVFYDPSSDSGIWCQAARELGLNPRDMFDDTVTESEAPYYRVVKGQDNILNIDIGGGTTDMFFVRRLDKQGLPMQQPEAYYISAKFAADDLWGDGAGARLNTAGENGFCRYLEEKIAENGESTDSIKSLVSRSSDIMAALFSNEERYHTRVHIRQNNNLRSVLLIHYTALLYAVSRILRKLDSGIPQVISFTGMGSNYLSLLCPNPQYLQAFTGSVLEQLTGQKLPFGFRLDTHFNEAKELTALGALEKGNVKPEFHISSSARRPLVDLGCDSYEFLQYSQLRNGDEAKEIRAEAKKVFMNFADFLAKPEFGRIAADTLKLSIPAQMIETMNQGADKSFNNVQGAIPQSFNNCSVGDNLFFWFLKDTLCTLSVNFYKTGGISSKNMK